MFGISESAMLFRLVRGVACPRSVARRLPLARGKHLESSSRNLVRFGTHGDSFWSLATPCIFVRFQLRVLPLQAQNLPASASSSGSSDTDDTSERRAFRSRADRGERADRGVPTASTVNVPVVGRNYRREPQARRSTPQRGDFVNQLRDCFTVEEVRAPLQAQRARPYVLMRHLLKTEPGPWPQPHP